MIISELKQIIQEKINSIPIGASEVLSTDEQINVVNAVSEIYSLLFDESPDAKPYIKFLEEYPSKENINYYFTTLSVLKRKIESLPFDEAKKGMMIGRLSEYCDLRLLSNFEKNGTLSGKELKQAIADLHQDSLADTVQVRTWGTKRELGSGFRNVILQQMRGEGVGHASVTMRFKADDRGRELIAKYCQDSNGDIKIPYELKQYGGEIIYEVYWSFWPGGLQTLDTDIRTEHSSVEHQDNVDILSAMPLELRSRYLSQKYTKDRQLPVLGSLAGNEKPLFSSTVPNSRKMGLSIASVDVSKVEPDLFRRNYLELKIQQYKLDEEINSLDTLSSNYLASDKMLNKHLINDKVKIRPNSNFLILLSRFLPQLEDRTVAAQIILSKEITKEQSTVLDKEIAKLMHQKEQQKAALDKPIQQAASLIQQNYAEVSLLKDQIDELKSSVSAYRSVLNHLAIALNVTENTKVSGKSSLLTDREKESIQELHEQFSEHPKIREILGRCIEKGTIEPSDAPKLLTAFKDYKVDLGRRLSGDNQKLSTKVERLNDVLSANSNAKINFLEQTIEQHNQAIVRNNSEVEQFAMFQQKFEELLEVQQKIDQTKLAASSVEKAIIDYISGTPKPKKVKKEKGDAATVPHASSSKALDITYESLNGPITISIKTHKDAMRARGEIASVLDGLQKQKLAMVKQHVVADDDQKKAGSKKHAKNDSDSQIKFIYHSAAGEAHIRVIKSKKDMDSLKNALGACQSTLESQKNEAVRQLVHFKMGRNASIDDLSQKFRRSGSNDAHLRGFNIEKMLACASDLASKPDSFHLANENCSTTSMKLLQAGAPDDVGFMFDWHQPKDGEKVASNMFLTNPQTVYSAVKVVERARRGDLEASGLIDARRVLEPERSYNTLLNDLASSMTTYNDVNVSLPGKNVNTEGGESKTNWSFYFKFIPHLLKLYRDIFQTVKLKQEENDNTLESQMSRELKALSGNEYLVIDSVSPGLAIHRLSESLKSSKTNIPFFNTDTLSRVEVYILSIQAKEDKTDDEIKLLHNYKTIIAERDERLSCMEQTLSAGKNVKEQLEKREPNTEKLIWNMTDKERVEALVLNFIGEYQKIRNANYLSFLTSNFTHALDACESMEMKLNLIQKQVKDFPEGRSAKALSCCVSRDKILQMQESSYKARYSGAVLALKTQDNGLDNADNGLDNGLPSLDIR